MEDVAEKGVPVISLTAGCGPWRGAVPEVLDST